jgi:hypothetical protein
MWSGLGARTQDHLQGCALCAEDRVCCDEGRGVHSSSSAISMMASPARVVSVFVGDVGDCGVFSSIRVSPVMVRAGDIMAAGLAKCRCKRKRLKILRKRRKDRSH